MKDKTIEVLSDLTVHMKYAKYLPELNRRETWEELIARNKRMHIEKYPQLKTEIIDVYENFVATKKVLPSMRSLQFGGKPIEVSPNRIYNCAYLPVDDWRAFGEIMFLLLGGTGVGFSVQRHHIEKLPEIRKPQKTRRYLIGDSIEGWADAVKFLMKSYFTGGAKPEFDFRDIRPKGANLITSGGKAPGPEPLKRCLTEIELMLERKENGSQLKPIEVHDIVCHIADAVLAGGIRRAALISLFSFDDEDMRTCKFGNWWELNSQRGRANNSAVIIRNRIRKSDFINLWKKIEASGSGEPGVYFNNDKDWGTNPCFLTGDTLIQTYDGELTIKEIVEALESGNRVPEVWSYNTETGEKELDTIDDGALTRKNAEVISIELEDSTVIKLTPDHQVYTKNRGWIEAAKLTEEDDLVKW